MSELQRSNMLLLQNKNRIRLRRAFFFFIPLSFLFAQCQPRTPGAQQPNAGEADGATSEVETYNSTEMMTKDVLIVMGDSASAEARKIAKELPVRQEISERVRIVHIDAVQAAAVLKQPGLYLIEGGPMPEELAASLTEGEKLFIQGWLARIPESEKERAGEGLNWDDPNFEPPDSLK